MKNAQLLTTSILLSVILDSCGIIGPIFKTGMGVGVFITIAVILVIVVIVIKSGSKKT